MAATEGILTALNSFYQECHDETAEPPGVTLRRFIRFLTHGSLISSAFDHESALKVFQQASGGRVDATLDLPSFKAALQGCANQAYLNTNFGSSKTTVLEPTMKVVAMQELVREIITRRESRTGGTAGELRDVLVDADVIEAAYAYTDAVQQLFLSLSSKSGSTTTSPSRMGRRRSSRLSRFGESDPGVVNGRAAHQLCRTAGVVPTFVVAGELVDVARELVLVKAGFLLPAEHKYFDEQLMTHKVEDLDEKISGEPCYDFPQLMELLVAATLWMPPRKHLADAAARSQRVHEVFCSCFGPPRPPLPAAGGGNMDAAAEWLERTRLPRALTTTLGEQEVAAEGLPDIEALLASLRAELPQLPPSQGVHVPEPPASAKLQTPVPTKDDRIEEAKRALLLKRLGRPVTKKKVAAAAAEEAARPPLVANQVTWYAQPVRKLPRGFLPPDQRPQGRAQQLELFSSSLDSRRRQLQGLASPVAGWVLRLALIDEPLRAPTCRSEEVATLIETALTSRRLRHYDTAVAMLIQARRLWPTQSGRPVTPSMRSPSPDPGNTARSAVASSTPLRSTTPSAASEKRQESRRGSQHSTGSSSSSPSTAGKPGDRDADFPERSRIGSLLRYSPDDNFAVAFDKADDIPPEVGIYFLCELASLHTAMHEDTRALQLLWEARSYSDRLSARHPFSSVVWCAVCRAALHAGQVEIAARAGAHARVLCEETLGEDTTETATAYNNLACCLFELDRPLEAAAYLELAGEILRSLAGESHPRTQTALRNLEKARTAQKHLRLQSPHLFSYLVKVPGVFVPKAPPKKKKGSRSGSRSPKRAGRPASGGRQLLGK